LSAVLGLREQSYPVAEAAANEVDRAVAGAVVDEDDLDANVFLSEERAEAQLQVVAPVPVDHDGGGVDVGIETTQRSRLFGSRRNTGEFHAAVLSHRSGEEDSRKQRVKG